MFNISEKAANEIKKLLLDEDDKTMFLRVRVAVSYTHLTLPTKRIV